VLLVRERLDRREERLHRGIETRIRVRCSRPPVDRR
jgi:hypothetical protein